MPGPVPVSIDIGRIRDPGGKEPFLDIQAPAVPDLGTLSRITKVIDMAYRDREPDVAASEWTKTRFPLKSLV